MRTPHCLGWAAVAGLLASCTPALDWREVRPAGSGVVALFPCKPQQQTRQVRLGAQAVALTLHACKAGASTWALAIADLGDPALVAPALDELRAAAAQNLAAQQTRVLSLKVAGATPNPSSRRVELTGRMPDGRVAHEQLAVFTRGTFVFQATALGEALDAQATDTFFDNLRFAP